MLIKASLTSHLPLGMNNLGCINYVLCYICHSCAIPFCLDLAPFEVHLGSIDTTAGKKSSRSSSGSGKRELKEDESERFIKKQKSEMQSDSDNDEEIIEDDSFNNYDDSFKSTSYKDRKSQNVPNARHASTPSHHSDADSSAGPLVDV
jgi:hypothetical protein